MSARANDVEPFEYLMYVFEHLPTATTVEQFEALLPWKVKAVLQQRKEEKAETRRSLRLYPLCDVNAIRG
jgi:hypothetical protein